MFNQGASIGSEHSSLQALELLVLFSNPVELSQSETRHAKYFRQMCL